MTGFIALLCLVSLTLGLWLGREAQVTANRRRELDWEWRLWHERHRSAWLEAEAGELRAELARMRQVLSEGMARLEHDVED